MYLKFFEYSTKKDNVANFFVLFVEDKKQIFYRHFTHKNK